MNIEYENTRYDGAYSPRCGALGSELRLTVHRCTVTKRAMLSALKFRAVVAVLDNSR